MTLKASARKPNIPASAPAPKPTVGAPRPRIGHRVHAKRWEQEIPAVLVLEIKEAGETYEMRINMVLPFLPRPGDQLGVGPDQDYLQVDEVFWCKDEGLAVWFTPEPTNRRHAVDLFTEAGWLEWDDFRKQNHPQ